MSKSGPAVEFPGENSDYLLALRDTQLMAYPVERVPVADLVVTVTARTAGEDPGYAAEMAASEAAFAPILVHRATMSVVDGVHRLRAAVLRAQNDISVRFFDGSEDDAYLLAVALNAVHGRPLSAQDRAAAVTRILATRPQWADRAVAAVTGLSPQTVAAVRRRSGIAKDQSATRVGRDGRARPLNSAQGRTVASRLLRENPDASLRQIGKQAGISPATVADVRERVRRGDHPVPVQQRACAQDKRGTPAGPRRGAVRLAVSGPASPQQLAAIFDSLRRDPSLRFNESGRALLRTAEACLLVARDPNTFASMLPPHRKDQMSALARGFAEVWNAFAEQLSQNEFPETG